MSLRDEIEGLPEPSTYKLHQIIEGLLLPTRGEGLTEAERAELEEIALDKKIPHSAIGTILRKKGYEITESSIARYRKELHDPWR